MTRSQKSIENTFNLFLIRSTQDPPRLSIGAAISYGFVSSGHLIKKIVDFFQLLLFIQDIRKLA